jgi:hypothetical protein
MYELVKPSYAIPAIRHFNSHLPRHTVGAEVKEGNGQG